PSGPLTTALNSRKTLSAYRVVASRRKAPARPVAESNLPNSTTRPRTSGAGRSTGGRNPPSCRESRPGSWTHAASNSDENATRIPDRVFRTKPRFMPRSLCCLLQIVEQPLAGAAEHIVHQVEALRAAVVRIGYFRLLPVGLGVPRAHEADLRVVLRIRELAQVAQVGLVHGDDQVELLEVVGDFHPARAAREDEAVLVGHRLRARIGRVAHVPVADAAGIHFVAIQRSTLARELQEQAFRQRRAADVAHADEQDFHRTVR